MKKVRRELLAADLFVTRKQTITAYFRMTLAMVSPISAGDCTT
jgi:hypothetical protein